MLKVMKQRCHFPIGLSFAFQSTRIKELVRNNGVDVWLVFNFIQPLSFHGNLMRSTLHCIPAF